MINLKKIRSEKLLKKNPLCIWLFILISLLILYFCFPDLINLDFLNIFVSKYKWVAIILFILIITLISLTLIPTTPFVLSGLLFFSPLETFVYSLIIIFIYTYITYYFAKYLGLESEQRLIGGGVSACATCDGFFYRKQNVVVVGAGDTAAEEATYLSNICNKVTLLVRKDYMRASKAMQHRVDKTANIEVKYNTEIDEVLGEKVVEGVRAVNNKTGKKEVIDVTGVFIAIGHKPNTDLFKGILDMDENEYWG
jgi:hypothetical protein